MNRFAIAFLVTAMVAACLLVPGLPYIQKAQLYPGPEGLDCGVVGYQVKEPSGYAGYYRTDELFPNDDLSPHYEWTQYPTVDPYNTRIKKSEKTWWYWTDKTILAERQQPTRDSSLEGRKIEYWIDVDENTSKHIIGTVVPWTFTVQISLHGSIHSSPAFKDGEGVWFGLGTKAWDQAYPDPDNRDVYSHAGWSIPLSVYIEEYENADLWVDDENNWKNPEREWIDECVDVTPSLSGRTVTLFNDPETPVTLDDIWYQGGLSTSGVADALNGLNSSVAQNPYPDTEFQSHCYFKFGFDTFKVHYETDFWGSHTATWYPSIYYRLRVYYLELGEFVYVQQEEDLPPWTPRGWTSIFTPTWYWWEDVASFFNAINPFRIFGPFGPFVAFLFLLAIVFVGILVALFIFFPAHMTRGAHGVGRAIHGYGKGRSGK